jgi:CRISPR type I-E-associated protein CasB/Cse2
MSNNDAFIRYLHSLKREDTGAIAALRRACGQRLVESRNCQWFASISTTPADFLTATLVAQYPSDKIKKGQHSYVYQHKGSIGAAWARYCRERDPEQDPASFYRRRQDALAKGHAPPGPPSIHERFRTLLDAELERDGTGELAYRLRGLVRMLVAEDIPIDVIQLAQDLRRWRAEGRYVQERWAKAFYGPPSADKSAKAESDEQDETEELEALVQEEDENVD